MLLKSTYLRKDNEVITTLQNLIKSENDIQVIHLYCINVSNEIAELINAFLICPNCHIENLLFEKCSISSIFEYNAKCIIDGISKNKTIMSIDISYTRFHNDDMVLHNDEASLDEFVSNLMIAIQYHPYIRKLVLNGNNIKESVFDIIKYKPINLKHIELRNNLNLNIDSVKCLVNKGNMQSIDIFSSIRDYNSSYIDDFCLDLDMNRSLLSFNINVLSHFGNYELIESSKRLLDKIKIMKRRNQKAYTDAKWTSIYLIAIRKYRRSKCGILGWVPLELVIQIAKYIFESYSDIKWHQNVENTLIYTSTIN